MKIAVFGWYGHDNAGDERIKYCLQSFLMGFGGIKAIDFYDLHNEAIKGATPKFDDHNLVIIGGGGLILSRHNYHDFIMGINTKVVTLGISVETDLKGNPKKFAEALLKKSDAVLVRDRASHKKLQPLNDSHKVRVTSDLTFLVPFTPTLNTDRKQLGVNLLPKPKHIQYSTLSNKLINFLLCQLERFGLTNLLQTVSFSELINVLKGKFPCVPIPMYCAPQQGIIPTYRKNDVNFLKEYFDNVADTFSDQLLDKCFVLLSMRLHGSIFAVQKNIPVVSFQYLPKNRSFMKEVGLENFVIDSPDPKDFLLLLDKITKNDKMIRDQMASYTERASQIVRRDLTEIINRIMG
ncbi:MAG: polysaccharide pyruvyl transferase family protein [Alphaproteobacteria bacterium]|nr:polysaccharide pyruvyl transferase family protein [Alphaproteobacteria bacterium]